MAKTKLKITDNSTSRKIISPTQVQMDEWVADELAEVDEVSMLKDDVPDSIFYDESID